MTIGQLIKYISIHGISEDTEIKVKTNSGDFEVDWCQYTNCLKLKARQDYAEPKGGINLMDGQNTFVKNIIMNEIMKQIGDDDKILAGSLTVRLTDESFYDGKHNLGQVKNRCLQIRWSESVNKEEKDNVR